MQNIVNCMPICIEKWEAWWTLVSRKKNIKPRFWLILMAVLVLVFASMYVSQNGYLAQQAEQIAQLQQQQDDATNENAELERKISFAKTDEYVERVARDELGLLKPGEVRFVASPGATNDQ